MARESDDRPHHAAYADALRAFAIMLVVVSHLPTVVPHLVGVDFAAWGVNCFSS